MKKSKVWNLLLIAVVALPLMVSCSKDDDGGTGGGGGSTNTNTNPPVADIHVVVNEDGTTSNGSLFSAIDDKNFYVDYIKYTVKDGHLVVSGYDPLGFKGVANIIARITYKGNTYEVLGIGYRSNDIFPFKYCKKLTSVIIPNSVTYIDSDAFHGCSSLTSVTIGNGLTSIGGSAFSGCVGLTSVDIPNSVTTIGREAFRDCKGLTSIIIPASIISIYETAFSGCDEIVSVEVDKNNSIYESRDGKTIIEKATDKIIVPCPSIDAVPPSFKEVVISPAKPNIGDTVTATLKFISAGKNWYKMEYKWTLSRYQQEAKYNVKGEGSSLEMKEPTFTFVVPDTAGMYTLRVNAGAVSASSLFSNGSPFGSASIENNSVTFTVRAKE